MLNKIQYNIEFLSTGRSLKGDFSFNKGMTGIVGPNESGKSIVLEMIRYGLFGTKALRTSVSSYKKIECSLMFTINGKTYTVKRSKSGSDVLSLDSTPIASGTKPVNSAIERLLGYNLEVFDVSNACLQGQVEALSDKTPAQRKRMVDKTIGLDVLDDLINDVSSSLRDLKNQKDALESTLVELTEPEQPDGYLPPEQLNKKLEELRVKQEKFNAAQIWLSKFKVDEPQEPKYYSMTALSCARSELDTSEKLQVEYLKNLEALATCDAKLSVLPVVEDLKEVSEIEALEQQLVEYTSYLEHLRQYPRPELSPEEITVCLKNIKDNFSYKEKVNIENRLEQLKQEKVTCPKCDHGFHVSNEAEIAELTSRLLEYSHLEGYVVQDCPHSEEFLNQQVTQWEVYNERPATPVVEKPEFTSADIRVWRQQRENAKVRLDLLETKHDLEKDKTQLVDFSEIIVRQKARIQSLQEYESALKAYEAFLLEKPKYESLVDCSGEQTLLMQWLRDFSKYDAELESYSKQFEVMRERKEKIQELKILIKSKENAKKGLNALKPRIKMFLVPSLNKVASALISQMTQGERSVIKIDENFDIKVDNQSIEELSGSGAAVANLAIRIGLGRVLTHKVFNVFLGDEIDASMDSDRAGYTAQCLRNLNSNLDQIILVSHHRPEVDQQIEMRK